MNMKYLLAASAAALIAASSAQAADVVQYQEPAPVVVAAPTFSWQGFYIGGQIGGSWADTDVKAHDAFGRAKWSPDPSGFIGGLYAGYNFDAGNNIILGLETDFLWSDMDESNSKHYNILNGAGGFDQGHARTNLKQKWAGATRVRVGYAMDRWLPFIAGGVAYAKVDSSVRGNATDALGLAIPFSASRFSGSDTYTGWTIGAGVDYAMTDNVLVRLEYRYSDFGDQSYRSGDFKYKVDYKTNDFRVGVAYKF